MAKFSKLRCNKLYIGQSSGYATQVTMTGTEAGYLSDVTAGAAAASKAVVLDANMDFGVTAAGTDGIRVLALGQDTAGTKGQLKLWPDTTAKGQLVIEAADNSGDDIVTLTTSNTGAAATIKLPAATGTLTYQGQADLQVGTAAGTVTGLTIFSDTAAKGLFKLTKTDSTADDDVTLTAGDVADDRTITITDPGNANAYMVNTLDSTAGALGATLTEIDAVADASARTETVTAANVLAAGETEAVFFLNSAGGFTTTLPPVATSAGYRYRLIAKTAPTTAYILLTNGAEGAIIIGNVGCSEINDATDDPFSNGATQVNMVANQFKVGDWLEVISDGAKWYLSGHTQVTAGVTFA